MKDRSSASPKRKGFIFLNPYDDVAFTKCPKCEGKTKQRKIPLVIHIDPDQMFFLNKTCRYCPHCDLVIARQRDVESLIAAAFEERRPEIVGNKYLVVGTLDKADWRQYSQAEAPEAADVFEHMWVFKDQLFFEMTGG